MRIIFLGVGSAFCMRGYQSNLVIRENEKNFLVDAGGDIRFSLKDQDMSYKDIDVVYVSHLHADHIGGLEYLAFASFFDPVCKPIPLYGHKALLDDLWNNSLRGGLASLQGMVLTLEDYFRLKQLKDNVVFKWQGLKMNMVQSIHIMNGYTLVNTYGLMVKTSKGKKLYITGDSQFCPNQIMDFYKEADIIIQDCETSPYRSGVHAHYDDLITLPNDVKRKMYLWHYQDNVVKDFHMRRLQSENHGFKGFAVVGTDITID